MRDSEARYRLLVDARATHLHLDRVGTVTSLNPALREILGSTGRLDRQHFAGLVYQTTSRSRARLFQRAVSGAALPNSISAWRDASAQGAGRVHDLDRARRRARAQRVGVGRDITERKQAETRRACAGPRFVRGAGPLHGHVDEALAAVHEQVAGALGCVHVATVLCDPGTTTVTRIAPGERFPPTAPRRARTKRFTPRTSSSAPSSAARPACCTPKPATPRRTAIPIRDRGVRAALPEGVIGTLVVRRDGPGGFDGGRSSCCDRVAREMGWPSRPHDVVARMQENAAVSRRWRASARADHLGRHAAAARAAVPVTAEVLGSTPATPFCATRAWGGAFVRAASSVIRRRSPEALRAVPILDEHTPGLAWRRSSATGSLLAHATMARSHDRCGCLRHAPRGLHRAAARSTLVGAQVAALRSDDVVFGPRHVRIAQGIAQLASLAIAKHPGRRASRRRAASNLISCRPCRTSCARADVILATNDRCARGVGTLNAPQREPCARARQRGRAAGADRGDLD